MNISISFVENVELGIIAFHLLYAEHMTIFISHKVDEDFELLQL